MTLEAAKLNVQAALDAKTQILIAEIQRMLVDRPFALNSGASKASIDGIHFEYAWDSFQTVACPLNTSTGYCGRGSLLKLTRSPNLPLVPTDVEEALLRSAHAADEGSVREAFTELATEVFLAWFTSGWQLARGIEPSVRGFLSVHDTIWRTELDTGEEFRDDSGRVKFF
jgi:hypothetical protein